MRWEKDDKFVEAENGVSAELGVGAVSVVNSNLGILPDDQWLRQVPHSDQAAPSTVEGIGIGVM